MGPRLGGEGMDAFETGTVDAAPDLRPRFYQSSSPWPGLQSGTGVGSGLQQTEGGICIEVIDRVPEFAGLFAKHGVDQVGVVVTEGREKSASCRSAPTCPSSR